MTPLPIVAVCVCNDLHCCPDVIMDHSCEMLAIACISIACGVLGVKLTASEVHLAKLDGRRSSRGGYICVF
jgi:hypothetical protein